MNFKFFNTLSNSEEEFLPLDQNHIKVYACGPTVYDRPHIGNARSIVFYDFLIMALRATFEKVTYVRNITDVDDKIIARANEIGISESQLVDRVIGEFHSDITALGCIPPDHEPRATEYINQMVEMIQLLMEKSHAYESNGEILFRIKSYKKYGQLSNRKLEDLMAGARISIKDHKEYEHDFVLWKNVPKSEYGFNTPLGYGRPGWHIECSAMSTHLLGKDFDIHGGGIDLQFPHHENEIAQSVCSGSNIFSKYWIHNGFVMVNGEKMSKSLGNFITIKDLLDKNINPLAIRLCLISTHYRKPLDFTDKLIANATANLVKFQKHLVNFESLIDRNIKPNFKTMSDAAQSALCENLNISKFLAIMHALPKDIQNTHNGDPEKMKLAQGFFDMGRILGIF